MTTQLPVPNWTQAYIAANDFPIDIVSSDTQGRYTIAARDIRKGDFVRQAQPVLVFQAKRDISKGEALAHCYMDQSLEREERRAALKEEYYFDCDCDRCIRENNQTGNEGSMDAK
ncbi:hypothetical protein BJ741DRAFT_554830 [Chytriomyces cf. hyalinus JEL632]|nr:hypothetical protein BJ741DRAFT_554830 [Chytriomyces cf. hyalinus JEL632]